MTFFVAIPCPLVAEVMVASATLGLKSIEFLKSNSPEGSRTSGSTLVAV